MTEAPVTSDSLATWIESLSNWAASQAEIDALYLYGSQAAGRVHVRSDVDMAVLANLDISRERLWRLEDRWAAEWPDWLDLRVINLAPIPAQFEVITRGRRLWQRSLERVNEYESWVRRRFWDMKPLLSGQRVEHQCFVTRFNQPYRCAIQQ